MYRIKTSFQKYKKLLLMIDLNLKKKYMPSNTSFNVRISYKITLANAFMIVKAFILNLLS